MVKDSDVKLVLESWLDFALESAAKGEGEELAQKANLNPNTVRQIKSRKSCSAESIIRLLLAKGVSPQLLSNIYSTERAQNKSLQDWNQLGSSLSKSDRDQFIKLIKYMKKEWEIKN